MQVRRDFDLVYAQEEDPWAIGDADSERYERYRSLILEHATGRGSMLDVGCGFGAFLARFREDFGALTGVEVTDAAVRKGAARYPFLDLRKGAAQDLDAVLEPDARFDAIVFSDVVYYLAEEERHRALAAIARRLADGGLAFVAAWCPGGDYPTPDELRHAVAHHFAIEHEELLEDGHAVFLARRKRRLVAITIDHETWQPIPEGRRIDWEADVFRPTYELLDACDEVGAPLTLFAEMGEYLWARENEPEVAEAFARQWADAAARGHDVQLHLHPHWLPELGARFENGEWTWDFSYQRAHDYPGDLVALIGRCVAELERIIRPVRPDYRVTCFRAGTYLAQPFDRLYEALEANGLECDSSVYLGGAGRNDAPYDYRLAWSSHQPWFAARTDPQLKAPPAERAIVEVPVTTWSPADRWVLDGECGDSFAAPLIGRADAPPRSQAALRRHKRWHERIGNLYAMARPLRRALNVLMPRPVAWMVAGYPPERSVQHEYYVAIGHSKADLRIDGIRSQLRRIAADGRFEIVRMGELARVAREDLERGLTRSRREEAERQVAREYGAVMGDERNLSQSARLQAMVPLDTRRVLDLGCGAGMWSARIAELLPWVEVHGVDVGAEFVERARSLYGSDRVTFGEEDFAELSIADGAFDCVYADNSLEHAFDVDATLREAARVLAPDGVLVAALPSDARNPARVCDNHTWKTAPDDVAARLLGAGFARVTVTEVDTLRRLDMPPYPPSRDRMMYVRAYKSAMADPWSRAVAALRWTHGHLDPARSQETNDPIEVIAGGFAWCMGYTLSLGELLRREGYDVRWATLEAHGHPRGRGPEQIDTHEVLEITVDGRSRVLDPMAGTWFDASLADLLRDPSLARPQIPPDERWERLGYDLYATAKLYEKVRRVAVRRDPRRPHRFVPVRAYRLASALRRPT